MTVRPDTRGQEAGIIAGPGRQVGHTPARLDPGKGNHLAGVATRIERPVGIGPRIVGQRRGNVWRQAVFGLGQGQDRCRESKRCHSGSEADRAHNRPRKWATGLSGLARRMAQGRNNGKITTP